MFEANFRSDRITDFSSQDVIEFDRGRFADFGAVMARATQRGGDTIIEDDGGQILVLEQFSRNNLAADDFRFA